MKPLSQDEIARFSERLAAVARRLDEKGILTATDGNLSMRLPGGGMLITPAGICKGRLAGSDLVPVDEGGATVGTNIPSSELPMHRIIYAERADVGAVVHAHPPHATAYAVAGIALDRPILSESVLLLGEVPVVPYARPSGGALAEAIRPFLPGHSALLLRHHGAVAFGADIESAGYLMETLEHVAHIDLLVRRLGSDAELSGPQVEDLRRAGG